MPIQAQLDWLTANTTIKWITDFSSDQVVSGQKEDIDRYSRDQGTPIDFSTTLEPHWQRKFQSFGDNWNEDRQKYRILYDTMRSFFASFQGMRNKKIESIYERNSLQNKDFLGELASSHLIQMYMSGKKALDLIGRRELNISSGSLFERQFSETRNKLFEHNFNPNNVIPDLIIDPSFWNIISTSSTLPIYIHIHSTNSEREYEGYIDYYEDYYQLEEIFKNIVENF